MTVKAEDRPFVRSDAGTLSRAVVVRPGTAVDRLAPIKGESAPIAERAIEQHGILVRTLRDRGVTVEVIEATLDTPTEALIADLAVMLPDGAVLARPSSLERRGEIAALEALLARLGIPVLGRIAAPGLLDATDVAVAAGTVFIGVPRAGGIRRMRSNEFGRKALEAIATAAGYRVVELPMANDVLRLRNVFTVVGPQTVIAAPDKVDLTAAAGITTIAVPRGEDLAAGVLPLGERRVIANLRFRESIALMRRSKVTVEAIDLWEFGKAGVTPAALALAVKRA